MRGRLAALLLSTASAAGFAQSTTPTGAGGAPISTPDGEAPAVSPTPTATATEPDWAGIKARAEAEKAAWDARAAAAASQKAATEAAMARIGTFPGQTDIKGTVTMGTYGAKAEALLLVTRSTQLAARAIAPDLMPALRTRPTHTVLVLTGTNELATADALQFDLQLRSARLLLGLAQQRLAAAKAADSPRITGAARAATGTRGGRVAPIAAAGAVIDAFAKLGSYFQSDYTFGAVDVATAPGLVANALVDALRREGDAHRLVIPSNLVASDAAALTDALDPVQGDYLTAVSDQAEARSRAAELRRIKGDRAAAAALLYEASDAAATRAITSFETLVSSLTAVPADGQEPLAVRIIRQKAIQAELARDPGPLILLLSTKEAAAYYTRRNLWTFLGGPPLYTMGGVSMTYTLYENRGGAVLMAGAVGKHGGYRSVGRVERLTP